MPPDTQYIRVTLMTSSQEYKEVEQLFRKSINNDISIERIERVQNPFMWEKYCRWKNITWKKLCMQMYKMKEGSYRAINLHKILIKI